MNVKGQGWSSLTIPRLIQPSDLLGSASASHACAMWVDYEWHLWRCNKNLSSEIVIINWLSFLPATLVVLCSNMFTDYRAGIQLNVYSRIALTPHMQVFKEILKSPSHVYSHLKKIYTKKPWLPFSLYCVHRNRFQLRHPEALFFESVRVKKWGYFNRNKPFFRGEQNQYNDCLPLFLKFISIHFLCQRSIIQCTGQRCPTNYSCENPVTVPGKCCKVCEGEEDLNGSKLNNFTLVKGISF